MVGDIGFYPLDRALNKTSKLYVHFPPTLPLYPLSRPCEQGREGRSLLRGGFLRLNGGPLICRPWKRQKSQDPSSLLPEGMALSVDGIAAFTRTTIAS